MLTEFTDWIWRSDPAIPVDDPMHEVLRHEVLRLDRPIP